MENRRVQTVKVGQRSADLPRPAQDFRQRRRTGAAHPLGQILPLDEVHHQELRLADFEVMRHPGEIGMTQVGKESRLLEKLAPAIRREAAVLLDGAGLLQSLVEGPIDCAEAALTQDPLDAVTSEKLRAR